MKRFNNRLITISFWKSPGLRLSKCVKQGVQEWLNTVKNGQKNVRKHRFKNDEIVQNMKNGQKNGQIVGYMEYWNGSQVIKNG